MRILIIGASATGVGLARTLIADGQRVTLVDSDANRVREVGQRLDCTVVQRDGDDMATLERAGIATADVLVAVTENDDANVLVCSLAEAVHPDIPKIACVKDPDHFRSILGMVLGRGGMFAADRYQPFGLDWVVNPNWEVQRHVARTLMRRRRCGTLELEDGWCVLSPLIGPASPLVGRPAGRHFGIGDCRCRLLAVYDDDGGGVQTAADTALRAGRRAVILAREEDAKAVMKACDADEVMPVRCLMAGASPLVSFAMAVWQGVAGGKPDSNLLRWCWRGNIRLETVLVDSSPARCRLFAERFPGLKVFCGEATDPELVREEGLDRYDISFSFTDNCERNLLAAAYLKTKGVACTVALTENEDLADVVKKLGVDIAVPVRETMVDAIRNLLYGRRVLKVESVANGALDLAYFLVKKPSRVPNDATLLLVREKGDSAFRPPDAKTELAAGDCALLMLPTGRLADVRETFG